MEVYYVASEHTLGDRLNSVSTILDKLEPGRQIISCLDEPSVFKILFVSASLAEAQTFYNNLMLELETR